MNARPLLSAVLVGIGFLVAAGVGFATPREGTPARINGKDTHWARHLADGFSFEYPRGWQVTSSGGQAVVVTFGVSCLAMHWRATGHYRSGLAYHNFLMAAYRRADRAGVLKARKAYITLGGRRALWTSVSLAMFDRRRRPQHETRSVYMRSGGKLIVLRCFATRGTASLGAIRQMARLVTSLRVR